MKAALFVTVAVIFSTISAQAQQAEAPKFSVGDTWKLSDGREITVVSVTPEGSAVSGFYVECPKCLLHWDDTRSTTIKATEADGTPVPFTRLNGLFVGPNWKWYEWPLEVNKTWRLSAQGYTRGNLQNVTIDFTVKAYEDVKTKAGVFKAYRIERRWDMNWPGFRGSTWGDTVWYAPDVKWPVKVKSRNSDWELTSYSLK